MQLVQPVLQKSRMSSSVVFFLGILFHTEAGILSPTNNLLNPSFSPWAKEATLAPCPYELITPEMLSKKSSRQFLTEQIEIILINNLNRLKIPLSRTVNGVVMNLIVRGKDHVCYQDLQEYTCLLKTCYGKVKKICTGSF